MNVVISGSLVPRRGDRVVRRHRERHGDGHGVGGDGVGHCGLLVVMYVHLDERCGTSGLRRGCAERKKGIATKQLKMWDCPGLKPDDNGPSIRIAQPRDQRERGRSVLFPLGCCPWTLAAHLGDKALHYRGKFLPLCSTRPTLGC